MTEGHIARRKQRQKDTLQGTLMALLYPARALIVRPYTDSSELSYDNKKNPAYGQFHRGRKMTTSEMGFFLFCCEDSQRVNLFSNILYLFVCVN